ncbi:MAG: hypothetical protein DRI46_08355, partial [Chloroflexi bacterium]
MTDKVLKAVFYLRAEAENFKKVKNEAKSLTGEMLDLSDAYKKNVASAKEIRNALKALEAAEKGGSDEAEVLNTSLDHLSATMVKQEEAVKDTAKAMALAEDATEEQKAATKELANVIEEEGAAREQANEAIRENRQETELSTKASEEHIVAEKRLTKELEEGFVETKALTQATQKLSTAKEIAKLETAELSTSEGLLAQKQQASVRASKDILVQTARIKQEREQGIGAIKAEEAATHELATEKIVLNREIEEEVLHLRAVKQAAHNARVSEEELKNTTTLLGISMQDLKKSLITAVAAGGVAGLVFKGMELIGDGFRRAKDAAVEFQKASTQAFSDLQEQVARTKAQVPELVASQEELYTSSVRIARNIGRAPLEVATAMRKAQNL